MAVININWRPKKTSRKAGKKMKPAAGIALSAALTALIGFAAFYVVLPALHPKNPGFWIFLVVLMAVFSGLLGIFYTPDAPEIRDKDGKMIRRTGLQGIVLLLIVILAAAPFVLQFLTSSKLLHARSYSRILTVQEGTVDNIPSAEKTASIALMDTASAEKLGNREIGSLASVVSQYDVSEYTQIDFRGTPVKISPLRYAGFFKWYRNRKNGVPGYVLVNPVDMDADYTPLSQSMTYVPSAYFGENMERRMRFAFPTRMFDNLHFEIDEEGNPWYVASTYSHLVGLFGGKQVTGAILADPVSGAMQWYRAGEIPQWTDVVFSGDLICAQYNNYAQLQNGFLNSIFGQAGCRKVTEYANDDDETVSDFGYVSKDGDIWIYTGVTSLNTDSSNIGFILSNERTEETIFIDCAGADEFSAMAAAEGEVQEKRYRASFPSLILADGRPTYIMVLKDNSGLVKMYAAVNVEQYNIVATASTQKECLAKYSALVEGRITKEQATSDAVTVAVPETDTSAYEEKEITIERLQTIDRNGDTWLYVVDTEQNIYSARYEDVIGMLLVKEGDTIRILTDGTGFTLP